jgi:hypothetical protein
LIFIGPMNESEAPVNQGIQSHLAIPQTLLTEMVTALLPHRDASHRQDHFHLSERIADVAAELVQTELIDESAFEHHLHRLRLHAGEQDLHAVAMQFLNGDFEGRAGSMRSRIKSSENDGR